MLSDRMMPSGRFTNRPLYLQLRDALAARIANGQWKPNSAIPNESDLAREFGVSAGTMRKALDLMEAERLLTRRQGRGTFVNDQTSVELSARFSNLRSSDGKRPRGLVKTIEITEGSANDMERLRLRLRSQDGVYRVHRTRSERGNVFMVEDVSMPVDLFPKLAEKRGGIGPTIALAQEYGILLGRAEERIGIGNASAVAARALDVAAGTPVLMLDRVVFALDGRPIEWRLGCCHLTDMYYMAEMV
jgi:GntR family transcriptional regulator